MKAITSVQEYLELIKKIKIKNNVFFRGHSDNSYDLNPGIYRKIKAKKDKTLIDYEDKIYREVISKSPQEFLGKTTLESLALLQHYEAPTRVLDLTENALVALFFAVNSKLGENDGEVIVFDIPDNYVCHYNSDRVTILANIAKCEKDINYTHGMVPFFRDKIDEVENRRQDFDVLELIGGLYNENITDFLFQNSEYLSNEIAKNDFSISSYDEYFNYLKEKYEKENNELDEKELKIFNNSLVDNIQNILEIGVTRSIKSCNESFFGKLLHNIREDKSYFDAIIDPQHISQVLAVRPKLDNPRIVRQQGAFLIFGIKSLIIPGFVDAKPIAELNKDWVLKGFDEERILIDKDSKDNILKELEQLGINQSILFPEVDKVADFVRKKYQNKL